MCVICFEVVTIKVKCIMINFLARTKCMRALMGIFVVCCILFTIVPIFCRSIQLYLKSFACGGQPRHWTPNRSFCRMLLEKTSHLVYPSATNRYTSDHLTHRYYNRQKDYLTSCHGTEETGRTGNMGKHGEFTRNNFTVLNEKIYVGS